MRRFFFAQENDPCKGDWCLDVKKDMTDINLHYSFEEIRMMSTSNFKNIVRQAGENSAFEWLLSEKNKLSKIKHIEYSCLKLQDYLTLENLRLSTKQFAFNARGRMLEMRYNYRNHFKTSLQCEFHPDSADNQQHLVYCHSDIPSGQPNQYSEYEDLFGTEIEAFLRIIHILERNYKWRKQIKTHSER